MFISYIVAIKKHTCRSKIIGNIVHLYAKSAVFNFKKVQTIQFSECLLFLSFDYLFSGDDSIWKSHFSIFMARSTIVQEDNLQEQEHNWNVK